MFKKMRISVPAMLCYIVWLILMYSALVVIAGEFNPLEWKLIVRIAFSVLGIFCGFIWPHWYLEWEGRLREHNES
ncbi:hypothetical protein [Phaeocystidibacter luteus]|uniref:DUF2842 domain-containing protein n=1 Tax=Phaeocystidibacter luteus TaxID=911197 RepID=A0A6N6RLZ2_9FLAO|nr:hypothetical protein [Phaeocystidibacter luteus]KAB2814576.1 hypothetical protein F8C67_02215 [Phaeocystidibacter luteus]